MYAAGARGGGAMGGGKSAAIAAEVIPPINATDATSVRFIVPIPLLPSHTNVVRRCNAQDRKTLYPLGNTLNESVWRNRGLK